MSSTHVLGHKEAFTYTPTGRISTATDKNGNTTTYTYDAGGNIIETIDPNGHSSYFKYDNLNRLKEVHLYPEFPDYTVTTLKKRLKCVQLCLKCVIIFETRNNS